MRRPRRLPVLLLVLVAASWFAVPAAEAGGASFFMDRASYEPGDRAVGRTGINWEHSPLLGSPEEGPYYVYLVPMASLATVTEWPNDPASLPGAVFVDEIEITEGPIEIVPGHRMGPHGATIEFDVPDLPDGQYALDHCNRPCTTPLADITGGGLWIGPPPPVEQGTFPAPPAPTVTSAPTTTTVAVTTTAVTATAPAPTSHPDDIRPTALVSSDRGRPGWPSRSFGAALILTGSVVVAVAGLALVASRSRLRVVGASPVADTERGAQV